MAIKDDKPSKGRETKIDKGQTGQSNKKPKDAPAVPGMKTVQKTVKCAKCKREFTTTHSYSGSPEGGQIKVPVSCRYCKTPRTLVIEVPVESVHRDTASEG